MFKNASKYSIVENIYSPNHEVFVKIREKLVKVLNLPQNNLQLNLASQINFQKPIQLVHIRS